MRTRTSMLVCFIAVAVLGVSVPAGASLNGCNVEGTSEKKTTVYFANGIHTGPVASSLFVQELELAYKQSFEDLHTDSTYLFDMAFNYSKGAIGAIAQGLQRKMDEEGAGGVSPYLVYQLLRAPLSNDEVMRVFDVLAPLGKTPIGHTSDVLDRLREATVDIEAKALADRIRVESEHVGRYAADLIAGRRVLILAHGQGNLFTNSAVAAVKASQPTRADSIAYFGIASAAAETIGGAEYVTAHDDRVIDTLRGVHDVLPSNLDNDPGTGNDNRSVSNHELVRDYWSDELASRGEIDSNMLRLAESTPFPTQIAGTGAIRASLTWGEQPDVDLHVFEPNGSHVYYRNLVGQDGQLDVDDVSGWGPENYVVACNDVNAGTYEIGVNYYSGRAPEVAKVALFLGDGRSISPREKELLVAKGRAGNSSPEIMFEVIVEDDGDGNALYEVQ